MKRLIVCGLLSLCLGAASPSLAQQGPALCSGYAVQDRDTLWELSGQQLGDPNVWESIVTKNPFLQEPNRRVERNGRVIVILHPGECLQGLEAYGVVAAAAEPVNQVDEIVVHGSRGSNAEITAATITPSVLFLLGLCALVLLYIILTRNPATARRPQVEGGVTAETARERFETMSRQQRFDILEQVEGRIWGTMLVSYGDGSRMPRWVNGQRAFQARVRHSDGREEQLYMLQACGNDLRFGGIARYIPGPDFRFEVDAAPTAAEEPAVASATPVTSETADVPETDGMVQIEFKAETSEQPSLLRAKGIEVESLVFTQDPDGGVTIRYRKASRA